MEPKPKEYTRTKAEQDQKWWDDGNSFTIEKIVEPTNDDEDD